MDRWIVLALLLTSTCTSAYAQETKREAHHSSELQQSSAGTQQSSAVSSDSPNAALAKSTSDPLRGKIRQMPALPTLSALPGRVGTVDLKSRATLVGRADIVRTTASAREISSLTKTGAKTGQSGKTLRLDRAPNGTVRWMSGDLGRLSDLSLGKQTSESRYAELARSLAAPLADLLRLKNPEAELIPTRTTRDALGFLHARFAQSYEGLEIWGRDLHMHFDTEGRLYAINGSYEPTPSNVQQAPSLSDDEALQTVIDDLTVEGRWNPLSEEASAWLGVTGPSIGLVLYPDSDRGVRLAYEVSLHPNLLERYLYLVDAVDGSVLNKIARHCALDHTAPLSTALSVAGFPSSGHSPAARHARTAYDEPFETAPPQGPRKASSVRSGVFVDASAADLNGQMQPFRVYQHDDAFYYKIWDLPNVDLSQSQLPQEIAGGAMTITAKGTDLNADVQLEHVTSSDNTWADATSVSAHVNMQVAYSYFKSTHDRNAIDNNDQSLISIVHVTSGGAPLDNAYWTGRYMVYGDGDALFRPLAGALDVAGHEMTHGVIDHSAELIYQFQSGALNESFADVFGVMIDRDDLLVGEDITLQGTALRDLLNPDNPQVTDPQPAHMDQYETLTTDVDNGGVHINSGIPNRAAALAVQAIGREKVELIYYRALTVYLTRRSEFGDARIAIEQSAIDLYGESSPELTAIQEAFDAVGILTTTGTGGEGNEVPPQTGGESLITFMLEDGTIGLVNLTERDVLDPGDLADVDVLVFDHPAAKARGTDVDRAQLSTPMDGETIWFINQQNQLAFIEIETGEVNVFEDVFIAAAGDLWNASVSPDGSWVSIVSAYEDDARLYIFDGTEICCSLALEPETTQDDIPNQTLRYPDVVSWSPNPLVRRIAFDGYNEMTLESGTLSYWSIYELDIVPQMVFNLFPGQSTNISIGNVTYSNTDPDLLAFNLFDESGTADVLVVDFDSGTTTPLGIPGFTVDGQSITDAERPTFSPDDSRISMSSANLGALIFTDRDAGSLTALELKTTLGSSVHNPRWFMRGGTVVTENIAPIAGLTAAPTSGPAPLVVALDAAASTDANGDALTYHWEFGDGATGTGQSTQHTYMSEGSFSVQLTVTDPGGLTDTAAVQIDVGDDGPNLAFLRNFDQTEVQQLWLSDRSAPIDSGFVLGTNHFHDRAKAASFALPGGLPTGQLTEVRVWFAYKRDGLTNQEYRLEIFDGTPDSGPTGEPKFSAPLPLADVLADADLESVSSPTVHVLPEPIEVGQTFFVSVDFGTYTNADWANAAISATDRLGRRVAEVWERWTDGSWHNLSDAWFASNPDGFHLWIESIVQTGTSTSVDPEPALPQSFALLPNYPNPFNPRTTITYDLPAASTVRLAVHDVHGRLVATLLDQPQSAGRHDIVFDADGLASGVYFYRLETPSWTATRRLILLK